MSRPWHALVLPWILVSSLMLACGAEEKSFKPEPIVDPEELFWGIDLSTYTVRLSAIPPYDTFTVVATPINYRGEPLTELPAPRWSSGNPDFVQVTPDGRLIAIKATGTSSNGALLTATLTVNNLTHSANVFVQVVNDTAPRLGSFSLQPPAPDSAKSASQGQLDLGNNNAGLADNFSHVVGQRFFTGGQAFDTAGAPILNLPLQFRSSDPTVLQIVNNIETLSGTRLPVLKAKRPGVAKIYGDVTVFGVTKADTLLYQVGWPVYEVVEVGPGAQGRFSAPEVKIGLGGAVVWTGGVGRVVRTMMFGQSTTQTEVVFQDPTNVAAYNPATFLGGSLYGGQSICNFNFMTFTPPAADCNATGSLIVPAGGNAIRRFPVPGTYEYFNPQSGASGRIIVMDE